MCNYKRVTEMGTERYLPVLMYNKRQTAWQAASQRGSKNIWRATEYNFGANYLLLT